MLKNFLKSTIRSLGFDLRRYDPNRSEAAQFQAMLSAHRVNLIFDVGANVGRFGQALREAHYRGRIVSIEPLSTAHAQLLVARGLDQQWVVAPRVAIGSEDGEIEINVAGNSESSSVLDMLDAHSIAAPESRYIGSERIPLRKLDTMASDYLHPDSIPFLKIDTQGYEDRVLRGAPNLLKRVVGLQLELSLVPLYEDQCLYDDITNQLKMLDFELWSISPVFADIKTGRLLQVDATFFRN